MVLDGRLDAREGLGGGGHATFPGTFGGRGGAGGEMEGGRGEMGGRGAEGERVRWEGGRWGEREGREEDVSD